MRVGSLSERGEPMAISGRSISMLLGTYEFVKVVVPAKASPHPIDRLINEISKRMMYLIFENGLHGRSFYEISLKGRIKERVFPSKNTCEVTLTIIGKSSNFFNSLVKRLSYYDPSLLLKALSVVLEIIEQHSADAKVILKAIPEIEKAVQELLEGAKIEVENCFVKPILLECSKKLDEKNEALKKMELALTSSDKGLNYSETIRYKANQLLVEAKSFSVVTAYKTTSMAISSLAQSSILLAQESIAREKERVVVKMNSLAVDVAAKFVIDKICLLIVNGTLTVSIKMLSFLMAKNLFLAYGYNEEEAITAAQYISKAISIGFIGLRVFAIRNALATWTRNQEWRNHSEVDFDKILEANKMIASRLSNSIVTAISEKFSTGVSYFPETISQALRKFNANMSERIAKLVNQ